MFSTSSTSSTDFGSKKNTNFSAHSFRVVNATRQPPPPTQPTHQVCETSPNVVDIRIGTGYVSNVKVILSTPNQTVGGLEFVVTNGKKSTSTFCGRALGLSAWIGKPGQAVGAIGGTCDAPVTAVRRRGRSILEAAEADEAKLPQQPEAAAADAPSSPSPAVAADAPSSFSSSASSPAASLPPPPLPLPPHHADEEHRTSRQLPPPPRKAHQHHEDEEVASPAPALAAVASVAPPPSLSRRNLAQAPSRNGTTGGLSAGTLQIVLVPAPPGENDSGSYGNGVTFGG